MTDVHVVSREENSYFGAVLLASRGFDVALEHGIGGATAAVVMGKPMEVRLQDVQELSGSSRVGMVAAEGEDLSAGVAAVVARGVPDLLVVIGGGATGLIEAWDAANQHGLSRSRVFLVSAFVWGGRAGQPVVVNSEKHGLLCGFLAAPEPSARVLAEQIVPTARVVDPVAVALSSLNGLVHPVPMILGATEIDRDTNARFFVETFGAGVSAVARCVDEERLALAARLGLRLPTFEEMLDRYYAEEGVSGDTLQARVNGLPAYQSAQIPTDFQHRYLTHELRTNLAPMAEAAGILGVEAPVMRALVALGSILAGRDLAHGARETARRLLEVAGER